MALRSPQFTDVLNKTVAIGLADFRVMLPGRIEAYDAATQTADVLPLPRPAIFSDDGTETVEPYQVIPHVPVVSPRGGRYRITMPVTKGDGCLLLFADHSLDVWQARGGPYAPIDLREHHLSDAVALVGLQADPEAWTDAPTDELTIGKDGGLTVRVGETTIDLGGGSTDFVAMAAKVMAELATIRTWANAHTHLSASPGNPTAIAVPALAAAGSVASATVKVKA